MNLSYRLGWLGFRLMYATYFRWRVFNPERVPQTGAVILASNHASFLDPPLVGSGLKRCSGFRASERCCVRGTPCRWIATAAARRV
jgi:1-acyl-sn-glycerol-3-phosphate acyltransferase